MVLRGVHAHHSLRARVPIVLKVLVAGVVTSPKPVPWVARVLVKIWIHRIASGLAVVRHGQGGFKRILETRAVTVLRLHVGLTHGSPRVLRHLIATLNLRLHVLRR